MVAVTSARALCLLVLLAGCGKSGSSVDAALDDDAALTDGGPSSGDAEPRDVRPSADTGLEALDAGADAGLADAGLADAGMDAGLADTGTSSDAGSGDAGNGPGCPTIGPAVALGPITVRGLTELSGLVAGRVNPDVYWTHNDSKAELYAIDRLTLTLRAHLVLSSGATPYGDADAEDIAIRPLPGGSAEIYLGDIGSGHPGIALHIYRVIEPLLPAMVLNTTLEAEVMDVSPLQLSNAETLLVDPRDGTLVIVQKKRGPSACEVGQFSANSFATPNCSVPVSGLDNPSGGDVSPDGTYVAVRNESLAFVWVRPPGSALVDAFRGQRCAFPTLATPADGECNGEALGFSADGSSLTSASETGPCPMANAHGYTFQP